MNIIILILINNTYNDKEGFLILCKNIDLCSILQGKYLFVKK